MPSTFAQIRRPTTLAYLSGLLEGEGTFLSPPASSPGQIAIALAMTDDDVVARSALLLETKYGNVGRRHAHHKPVFAYRVRGGHAIEAMEALAPLMGGRRRAQIHQALDLCARHPRRPWATEVAKMAVLRARHADRRDVAAEFGIRPTSIDRLLRGDYRPLAEAQALACAVEQAEASLEKAVCGSTDTAWLAGLFEGEGSFSSRAVVLGMTDRDVVERVASLVPGMRVCREEAQRPEWKPMWRAALTGSRGVDLAERLRPALGLRRGARIASMVEGRAEPKQTRNLEITRRVLSGESGPALATEYGCSHQNIYYIVARYRHLVVCPSG